MRSSCLLVGQECVLVCRCRPGAGGQGRIVALPSSQGHRRLLTRVDVTHMKGSSRPWRGLRAGAADDDVDEGDDEMTQTRLQCAACSGPVDDDLLLHADQVERRPLGSEGLHAQAMCPCSLLRVTKTQSSRPKTQSFIVDTVVQHKRSRPLQIWSSIVETYLFMSETQSPTVETQSPSTENQSSVTDNYRQVAVNLTWTLRSLGDGKEVTRMTVGKSRHTRPARPADGHCWG